MRLDLRLTQQLVMTPQLQQAIRLLAMSNVELTEFVEGEVEKNPLLTIDPSDRPPAGERLVEADPPRPDNGMPRATDRGAEDHDLMRRTFDTGAENLVDTSPSDGPSPLGLGLDRIAMRGTSWEDGPDFTERLASPSDLRSDLRTQLGRMPGATGLPGRIALWLVEELDELGYLRTGIEEIATRLSVCPGDVATALRRLQTCEPTGVGARSLGECFALQLAERGRLDPMMQCMLDNLHLVARGDLRQLQHRCGADDEDFADMLAEIRTLDPRPCAAMTAEEPETLIPDILLTRTSWGGFTIELNPDTLPRVLIDREYRAVLRRDRAPEARQFLSECQASATWLIKSLDQRARTILRVATEIVRRQERFFRDGVSGLRPLTLREVAEAIDMHESTVSRVTTNKYVSTDHGVLELKFFFSNAVGGVEGGASSAAVRHRIKSLVAAETDADVLSDDAIVDALRAEGIDVARRTVAKYRKSLNIPSSVERRRQLVVAGRR